MGEWQELVEAHSGSVESRNEKPASERGKRPGFKVACDSADSCQSSQGI